MITFQTAATFKERPSLVFLPVVVVGMLRQLIDTDHFLWAKVWLLLKLQLALQPAHNRGPLLGVHRLDQALPLPALLARLPLKNVLLRPEVVVS